MASLLHTNARLHLFTGKGGVGKTTLAAAAAVEVARGGRRPLLVELGHRASMQGVFGVEDLGYEPREVSDGVFATNLDVDLAVLDYVAAHVKIRPLARALVGHRVLDGFFRAAPAVAEVAAYHRLASLLDDPRWDVLLVDLDATGHAMMFLELPAVLDGLLGKGPLRTLLDRFSGWLADPTRTALHLVTLPSELPVQETIELSHALQAGGHVAPTDVIVNRMPAAPLRGGLASLLPDLERRARRREAVEVLSAISWARRLEREHAQAVRAVARLDSLPLPLQFVERMPAPLSLAALVQRSEAP